MYTAEIYKGYGIDFNVYGSNEYTVHYCGDDCFFSTIKDAEQFIDEIAD